MANIYLVHRKDKKMYAQCYRYTKRKSHLCIPRKGIVRPQSQFPHTCVCERFIYSQDRSTDFVCSRIGRPIVGIYKLLTDTDFIVICSPSMFPRQTRWYFEKGGFPSLICSTEGRALFQTRRLCTNPVNHLTLKKMLCAERWWRGARAPRATCCWGTPTWPSLSQSAHSRSTSR